jgi:hypothetical protein
MTDALLFPKRIHVVHHQPNYDRKGGVCLIAYHDHGDSFIRICSSLCSPLDQYAKKTGYRNAHQEMAVDSGIRLPVPASLRRKMTYGNLRGFLNHFAINVSETF